MMDAPSLWSIVEEGPIWVAGSVMSQRHAELIDGTLIVSAEHSPEHAVVSATVGEALRATFPPAAYWTLRRSPLQLGPVDWPRPDAAVVAGPLRDWRDKPGPTSALLVVEVIEGLHGHIRASKAAMYARAAIADYWILNLIDRVLEVHRDPVPDASWPFGHRYADVRVLDAAATVSPLAMPSATISVADLLP